MKPFLQILFMPIARFCLRHGVSLPECIDALKAALLSASIETLKERNEPLTASRLSIMSGVHRKDSARFLKGVAPERDTISLSIKVLGIWHTRKKYLDSNGKPKLLGAGTEDSAFARLVHEVSADIHPYTILKELERLSLIEVTPDGIRPLKASYISSLNDEGTAKIIARDIDDLILSAEENIAATGKRPNHHTTTSYDNIPTEYLKELRDWILSEAGAFHKKIRAHISTYDRDLAERNLSDSGKGSVRFVFGSFGRVNEIKDGEHEN